MDDRSVSSSSSEDQTSPPSSPTKNTHRMLKFSSPDTFSLLNLPCCDHPTTNSVRPTKMMTNSTRSSKKRRRGVSLSKLSSSFAGNIDDSGSASSEDYNEDDDDDDNDDVDDDDDDILIDKIITSRKDTLDNWNKLCQTLNTSEVMNGSLWQNGDHQSNGLNRRQPNNQIMMLQERYQVKWKDLSYIHCTWETRERLEELTSNGIHQLNSFTKRRNHDDEGSDLMRSTDYGGKDGDDDMIKTFMMIDRILDVKSFGSLNNRIVLDRNDAHYEEGMGRTFLIKWCDLPYSDATYEHERDLILSKVEYESHYNAFVKRHAKPSMRQVKDNMAKHDRLVHHLRRLFRTTTSTQFNDGKNHNMEGYVKELQGHIYRNKGTLREYQAEGVAWMIANYVNGRSSILADEMGLGKTVQTAAFLNTLNDAFGNRGPFLIVAPLSTVIQWQREISSWTNLNVVLYTGNAADRAMIREYEFAYISDRPTKLRARQKYLKNCHVRHNAGLQKTWMVQVVVTTPETMLAKDQDELMSIDWEMLIIDEAHNRLKSRSSKFSMCLRNERFLFRRCLLLTGTPIQNNMDELWTLLNIIDPNVFADHDNFLSRYGNMQGKEQIDELHEVIRPYMLRRLKEDVEKDLPAREETIIEVELTSIQKQYYRALYEKNREFLSQNKGRIDSVNIIMELRKCCNHPFLLDGVEDKAAQGNEINSKQDEIDFLVKSSGKLVLLDKLLPKLKSGGHRVLIFSQFKIMLNIIEDYLQLKQYTYERIDGSITGKLRQLSIDRFQKNESSFIMLLTTKAGGVGINLTAADTCIIFDSDWNPQNDLQAQARCHRIGQTKDVKVYRFLTKKTYEMRLFHLGSMKLGLDKAVLQGVENKRENCITEQEAERLLRFGAYDVLSEDKNSLNENDSKSFMEEDIDTILLRRTKTQIHDRQMSSGFNFSKASFKLANSDSLDGALECDIDIDDPDFWSKMFAASDSKKENMTNTNSHDEMNPVHDCQDKDEDSDDGRLEEAAEKKTRIKASHKKVRNDPRRLSTSADDSDLNKRANSDLRMTKSKVVDLQTSKAHPESASNRKGRRRKRRGTLDASSSPSNSIRSKAMSPSAMRSPPNSTSISIRRSPRLNHNKRDELMGSVQNDISYAVAAGITRALGIDEKETPLVRSVPSKVRQRSLPKRRLFSPSMKEGNPQGQVDVKKSLEASKGNCQKVTNPITKTRKRKPQNAKVADASSSHVVSTPFLARTQMKCQQDDKSKDANSSINTTKASSSVKRGMISSSCTSIPTNTTRKTLSLNKRAPTSVPDGSKASLPISQFTKWIENTKCRTTISTKSSSLSSSPIVKRKRDGKLPTMTSSSIVTTSNTQSVSSTSSRSTKRRLMTIQSTDHKAQHVNHDKVAVPEVIESFTSLSHDVCKVQTQRGRKTRRPQYYVPPKSVRKRKRKIQEASASDSQSKAPLSNIDSKQHKGTSQEKTKQNVSPDAISVDNAMKVRTTFNRSKPTEIISKSTPRSQLDKQSRGSGTTKNWPFIGSNENVEKASETRLHELNTTVIVAKKTPSKRLSSNGSVLETLFAT